MRAVAGMMRGRAPVVMVGLAFGGWALRFTRRVSLPAPTGLSADPQR